MPLERRCRRHLIKVDGSKDCYGCLKHGTFHWCCPARGTCHTTLIDRTEANELCLFSGVSIGRDHTERHADDGGGDTEQFREAEYLKAFGKQPKRSRTDAARASAVKVRGAEEQARALAE